MSTDLDTIMKKRCQTIQRDAHVILESHGCSETGGGVVLAKNRWSQDDMAYFFKPRSHKTYFKSEKIISNHQRIALPGRVATLLAEMKAAKVAPHDLQPGEIIANIWGYSMQGVRFLKVKSVPHPRKVTVVSLDYQMVSGDFMNGTVKPVDREITPDDDTTTYMVDMSSGKPILVTKSSIERAGRWSGEPVSIYSD